MKIYRLLECSGEWEDYHEYRIGTYLTYDRAKEVMDEKVKLENEREEHSRMCCECEYGCGDNHKCSDFKEDENHECLNYFTIWDTSTFRIDEEEVED